MGSAQLWLLQGDGDIAIGNCLAKLFVPVARHDYRLRRRQFVKAVEQVEQHRLARDRVQHLVQVALHAGALARSKDNNGEIGHGKHTCHQMLAV